MKNKETQVAGYVRTERRDRVGDMLRAAENIRNPRTLKDWVSEFSAKNDDPSLPLKDRVLWHLDPIERRSVIVQAQSRMRVPLDEIIATDADGKEYVVQSKTEAGEFLHLLGRKLFPSTRTTGKIPTWCGDTATMDDTKTEPDGLSNPLMTDLLNRAVAAGDTKFGESAAFVKLALFPLRKRAFVVDQKKHAYIAITLANSQATKALNNLAKAEGERDQLRLENTTLRQTVEALEEQNRSHDSRISDIENMIRRGRSEPESVDA